MPTVTSENREEFIKKKLKEKNKPNVKNDFYSKYKDKLTPHKDYFEFVKGNEPHIREHAGNISKKIKTFTGLNEKQQAKKHHEHMSEMRNHVTEAWDYTKPND